MEIVDGIPYLPQVKALIRAYTNSLGKDLSFQHLEEELRDLTVKYAPPQGKLLCAVQDGRVWGCVAYTRHSDDRCEMKRLYVDPICRGRHLGQALVEAILAQAKADGYAEMVLDTLETLRSAVSLYHKNGFTEIPAYYYNPLPGVIYMRKEL